MRREFPQNPAPITTENIFGLGIQVYKIQSKLPRIPSGKNDKRQLSKLLENPGTKKYQKPDKSINISYDKIIENQNKCVNDAVESVRKRSVLNTRSNTLNRTNTNQKQKQKQKEKSHRPPSGKVILRLNSSNRKQKQTGLKTGKSTQAPSQILSAQQKERERASVCKVFPAFQNEQLRKLEDKIQEVTLRRKQTKRNLRKQLGMTKDQSEQQRILRRIQVIDSTDVVSEIVNLDELAPYKYESQFQQFGLEQYLLRQKGQYVIEDDDDEYEFIYKQAVHVSEQLEEQNGKQDQIQLNLVEELKKEQQTRDQQ